METKLLTLNEASIETDAKSGSISGYGSIFGNKDLGGDIVVKGAFAKSLAENANIKLLWGHDSHSPPIGVWEKVYEDEKGLKLDGRLFLETERGREAHVALKNGAIDGLSIGYQTVKANDTKAGRELTELKLHEVSVVNFPMNTAATVESVKTMSETGEKKRFLEGILRDAGFTVKQAKHGASVLVDDVLNERDAKDTTAAMAGALKQLTAELRSK